MQPIGWIIPLNCLPRCEPTSNFLWYLKYSCLQYAVLAPIAMFIAVICESFHSYGDGEFNLNQGKPHTTHTDTTHWPHRPPPTIPPPPPLVCIELNPGPATHTRERSHLLCLPRFVLCCPLLSCVRLFVRHYPYQLHSTRLTLRSRLALHNNEKRTHSLQPSH